MTPLRPPTAGGYARALEQALSRLRERPVVLSPRDWELVSDWHARGIPLAVVLEALEAVADRSRRRSRSPGPRSLAYVSSAVEEAWAVIREGRTERVVEGEGTLPSREAVLEAWRGAAADDSALSSTIRELVGRAERGDAADEIDAELDRRIPEVAPRNRVEAARCGVDAELEPFRARMTPARFEATRARALAARLRRELGFPRLSLTDRAP